MYIYKLCKKLLTHTTLVLALSGMFGSSAYAIGPTEVLNTYGPEATYKIVRNGKNIGTHTIRFTPDDQGLSVNIVSDIKVRVLKIPVYSFYYESNERWSTDRLLSVMSTVKEKGKTITTAYTFGDGIATMIDPDGNTSTGDVNFGSNHWNSSVLTENQLFNTLTGRANQVTVSAPTNERLSIGNAEIDTTHHVYSGELQAEVWYDSLGRWVQLLFKGEDGSVIKYISDGFDA